MSSLLEFIEQVVLMELAPEASSSEPFGQWLAPDIRKLGAQEDDTEEEQETVDALTSFMGSSNDPSQLSANNGEIAKKLLGLLQKHQYSPVLEPGVPVAYRGMSFGQGAQFQSILNSYHQNLNQLSLIIEEGAQPVPLKIEQITELLKTQQFHAIVGVINPFVFQTQQGKFVQSWTANKNIAVSDFMNKMGTGGMLIKASIPKNRFFGRPGEIGKIGGFSNEMETISVGPVQTEGAVFIFGPYLESAAITEFTKNF